MECPNKSTAQAVLFLGVTTAGRKLEVEVANFVAI
jgi:hypothetical protein